MVPLTIGTLVVGVIVVIALAISGGLGDTSITVRPAGNAPPPAGLADGQALGDPDAPVTIEVWSDFQCPVCGRLAEDIEPRLIQEYVVPGTVRLVYKDLAFLGTNLNSPGNESVLAATGGRFAAGQNRFWPYHDLVFANQQGENRGGFRVDRLVAIAEAAGLDPEAFRSALSDPALRRSVIDQTRTGLAAGLSSTPTLVINGTAYAGLPDYASLAALIDQLAGS
jgi:protein-disulfide isomerase